MSIARLSDLSSPANTEAAPESATERIFAILAAFEGGRHVLSMSAIAEQAGMSKSTTSRLLMSLEQSRLVIRCDDGKYRLAVQKLIQLTTHASPADRLVAHSRAFLEELAHEQQEDIELCGVEDGVLVHYDQIDGPHMVGNKSWMGLSAPLHATSGGKVLLAQWREAEQMAFLAKPLAQFTPNTITQPAIFLQHLRDIAQEGVAWGLEELEIGLIGTSAPIFLPNGKAVACVTVSGPIYRFPIAQRPAIAQRTKQCAAKISQHLQQISWF